MKTGQIAIANNVVEGMAAGPLAKAATIIALHFVGRGEVVPAA